MQTLVLAAYISSTQDIAIVVATSYVIASMLWAGIFVRLKDLWVLLRLISYITPCRYAVQIVLRQQFIRTTRASTLKVYNLVVPDTLNFCVLGIIYVALLGLTLAALVLLSRKSRK